MEEKQLTGKVSFVQYEKQFVTIEYLHNNVKLKSVNGSIKEEALLASGNMKKHYFREGDEVSFTLALSVRGDKMTATNIKFRFNNALNNLLNKATTENRFSGYLKQVDDELFVKEMDSYLFFPLKISPWELPPSTQTLNVPISFALENIDKPTKVSAVLAYRQFKPAYKKAQQWLDDEMVIEATVSKVTPHAIYVDLIADELSAKLLLKEDSTVAVGDKISVTITYLSPEKIVIQQK
jgi:hypothetical protein